MSLNMRPFRGFNLSKLGHLPIFKKNRDLEKTLIVDAPTKVGLASHWPVQLISKGTHERKEPARTNTVWNEESKHNKMGKKLRQIGCSLVENIKMGGFPLNSANGIPAPGQSCNLVLRGLWRSFQISPLLLLLQWILCIRCLGLGLILSKEKQGVPSSCLL